MSVINTANNLVTATITVGSRPAGIAITPNGSFAYVANDMSNSVSVINTANNLVTATIPVETNPGFVSITPNGSFAYISNSGTLSVINIANSLVTATITTSALGTAITPNGFFPYVSNQGGGAVNVIQTSTNTITATVIVGTGPYYLAITPSLPTAPLVTAAQQRLVFASQTDLYAVVGWTTAGSTAIYTNFFVYRDAALTMLAGTVNNNTLRFEDHNLNAGQTYSYYVVGYTQLQGLIPFGSASITIAP